MATMRIRYFVTSTGTGVGKTYVAASLIRQARVSGNNVAAYKPVVSGFENESLSETDTGALIGALGLQPTSTIVERLSPWRYRAALAPSMAARREGREIDFGELVAFSRQAAQSEAEIVLIEGVGGVMAPINDTHTVLDWIEQAGIPLLLVVGSYLGTISHTLTALEAIGRRSIRVDAIVVNESPVSPVALEEIVQEIERRAKTAPVIGMMRESDGHELRRLLNKPY
jgi:dethiobiotin synthetase